MLRMKLRKQQKRPKRRMWESKWEKGGRKSRLVGVLPNVMILYISGDVVNLLLMF